MTKKDYELLARIISAHLAIAQSKGGDECEASYALGDFAVSLAANLGAEPGSRFNAERFLKACGVDSRP